MTDLYPTQGELWSGSGGDACVGGTSRPAWFSASDPTLGRHRSMELWFLKTRFLKTGLHHFTTPPLRGNRPERLNMPTE